LTVEGHFHYGSACLYREYVTVLLDYRLGGTELASSLSAFFKMRIREFRVEWGSLWADLRGKEKGFGASTQTTGSKCHHVFFLLEENIKGFVL
jgi:hypothetical protein